PVELPHRFVAQARVHAGESDQPIRALRRRGDAVVRWPEMVAAGLRRADDRPVNTGFIHQGEQRLLTLRVALNRLAQQGEDVDNHRQLPWRTPASSRAIFPCSTS